MNISNSRSTLRQDTAIQRGARLILVSTSFSLLCACGGGTAVSESHLDRLDTVVATIQPAPPPKVVDVDVVALQYALDDPNPGTRQDTIERLGDLATDEAVRGLERALLDSDPGVRAAAIDELAGIPGDASAYALSIALWNDDAEVREDVIDALAEVGGVVAIGLLEQSLSDEDAHLREVAAEYLAEIAGVYALTPLLGHREAS